jgi:hypothetical protein
MNDVCTGSSQQNRAEGILERHLFKNMLKISSWP